MMVEGGFPSVSVAEVLEDNLLGIEFFIFTLSPSWLPEAIAGSAMTIAIMASRKLLMNRFISQIVVALRIDLH